MKINPDIEVILAQNAAQVEQALRALPTQYPELYGMPDRASLATLHEAEQYSLLAGGKRIRPTLTIEVCRMLGGEIQAVLPFACAVEMVHTYSLIHDDLPCMDNDDLRRGKPTNHKVYGEAIATLSGDGLLTDAFYLLSTNGALSPEVRLTAVRLLAEAAGSAGMVGGQVMDMEGERNRLPLDTLLRLHQRKTGAMIRLAVQLGALAAGVLPDTQPDSAYARLVTYAEKIGLAFQVVDDSLDADGDSTTLGKTVGKDQAVEKTTFLTYYTPRQAREYAVQLSREACDALEGMPNNEVLCVIATHLAQRDR